MEPLPSGANFKRAKMLWEIGLHIAGDPAIPYGGNRDMAGWKMLGFPGAHDDYRPYVAQHNKTLDIAPVGIYGGPAWEAKS